MLDEIGYTFRNFNGVIFDVCEWINNFIKCFTNHLVTYPCWLHYHFCTFKHTSTYKNIALQLCQSELMLLMIYSLYNAYAVEGTVYPKKYAHGFVMLCFVVVMQSFIMNSYEAFIPIHQGCFAGTGAIVRLPQCQWSKPDGYGKISQCITTTKHSKAKTVCIFLGIYCSFNYNALVVSK